MMRPSQQNFDKRRYTHTSEARKPGRSVRSDICTRAGGFCEYCGDHVGMKGTLDHFVPWSRGGGNDYANLRWACLSCNNLKGSMMPDEWSAAGPKRRKRPETRLEIRIRLAIEVAQRARQMRTQQRIAVRSPGDTPEP